MSKYFAILLVAIAISFPFRQTFGTTAPLKIPNYTGKIIAQFKRRKVGPAGNKLKRMAKEGRVGLRNK